MREHGASKEEFGTLIGNASGVSASRLSQWTEQSFGSNEGYELGKDLFSLYLEPLEEVNEEGDEMDDEDGSN